MINYVLLLVIALFPLSASAEDFQANKDFIVISNSETTNPQKVVQVTEFFSYGCPWCYRIEPGLKQWLGRQAGKITYEKIPVIFKPDWEYYAKAFYTAKALGIEPELTSSFFKAVLEEKQMLNSNQAMVNFFTAHGIDMKTAQSAFLYSPAIEMSIHEGQKTMANAQINAIPAFIINHHFKTNLQMAGSEERLWAILDFLVTRETVLPKIK